MPEDGIDWTASDVIEGAGDLCALAEICGSVDGLPAEGVCGGCAGCEELSFSRGDDGSCDDCTPEFRGGFGKDGTDSVDVD